MARLALVIALAAGAATAACTARPSFVCQTNSDCISETGTQGICELDSSCTFVDPTCPETGRRYPDGAAPELASQCLAAPASCVSQLVVGSSHSCALRSDGTVWCWGLNDDGEVSASAGDQLAPVQVDGLPSGHKATAIAAGEVHTCALMDDGTVWCWGGNGSRQLGQCGSNIPDGSMTPVEVIGYTANGSNAGSPTCNPSVPFKAKQITAGGQHNCAIGVDGNLYCWGENQTGAEGGQSGQDPTVLDDVPGPLKIEFDGAVQVAAGDEYSCLLKDENSVWCFGANGLGELATGTTTDSFTPVNVTGLSDAASLVLDDDLGCALSKDGGLYCWGNAETGVFGTDLSDNVLKATRIGAATEAYGGGTGDAICLTQNDGTIECLGANDDGQAGIAGGDAAITQATGVPLVTAKTISTGGDHTCAETSDGALWCWGNNAHGQLGNGEMSMTSSPTPVRVLWTCP